MVLGSKFARSESGFIFFVRSILTWPCQNTIFPTCSTSFDLLWTQIPPKFSLGGPGGLWEGSLGGSLVEGGSPGGPRVTREENESKPSYFTVFSCASDH